ncbi:hypothetical protein TRIP_C21129 [Candidatus Zixiibacteriota bacterium]|nr:hypothetical protein TRIP_C21129 [candidate division Zixibacteria bacterium]
MDNSYQYYPILSPIYIDPSTLASENIHFTHIFAPFFL